MTVSKKKRNNVLKSSIFLFFLFLHSSLSSAEPLRTVRDVHGELWEEYFDENTQHFYYFSPQREEVSWLVDFPSSSINSLDYDRKNSLHLKKSEEDLIDEMFPVLSKGESRFEVLEVFPEDAEELHHRKDPAGKLHSQRIKCLFDHLAGVKARVNFPMALKAPVAFHHMFISEESRQKSVSKERKIVENILLEDPNSAESWENLGHIWRVYGNVHRTMDCYRRALEISPYEKSSLYINIAGLLDQMNYIQDALEVLEAMLTSFEAISTDSESSIALGYVMAAQLRVRNKNPGNLTLASKMIEASLTLHPQFHSAIFGLQQEIHYRNNSFGGPPWLFGGTGSWCFEKNPWFVLEFVASMGKAIGFGRLLDLCNRATLNFPLVSLFLRKSFNAFPAIIGGILSRYLLLNGAYIPFPYLKSSIPVFVPLVFCLFLPLQTEYLLFDCILLLIAGFIISFEPRIEKSLIVEMEVDACLERKNKKV